MLLLIPRILLGSQDFQDVTLEKTRLSREKSWKTVWLARVNREETVHESLQSHTADRGTLVEERLIVLDYKTDGIDTAEEIAQSMERYRLQSGTYALGLETATGKSVRKVIFLFLRTGVEFVMDDLLGAMNDVRGAVVGLTA